LPRQRGAALLIFSIIIVMAALAYLVSSLAPDLSEARRERKSQEALAQAREALIGYALTYRDRKPDLMYGYLPMPDIGRRGTTNDENCHDALNRPLEGCQAPPSPSDISKVDGAYLPTLVGRFPWRTLGMPPLRDGHGECLWLIVSSSVLSGNASQTNIPFNWDTLGYLDIHVANDNSALQSLFANKPHDRPWAIVYSPGPPLPGQDRSDKVNGDDVTECGGNYDARNYLDPYILNALGDIRNSLANTHNASDDPNDFTYRKTNPIKVTTDGKVFKSGSNYLPNACQGADCTLLANDRGLILSGDKLFDVIRNKRSEFRADIDNLLEKITDCLSGAVSDPSCSIGAAPDTSGFAQPADKTVGRVVDNTYYDDTKLPKGYWSHYREMLFHVKPNSGNLNVNGKPCTGALIFGSQRNSRWESAGESSGNTPKCPKDNPANPYQCRVTVGDKSNIANYLEGINRKSFTELGTDFSGATTFEPVSINQTAHQDIVRCIGPTGSPSPFATTQSAGLLTAGFPQLAAYSTTTRTLALGQQVHTALSSSLANFLYGCAWRPETHAMGGGLRSYFTFRIDDSGLYSAWPQLGLTFAIVDGDNNGTDACGAAGQHLGYSGNNTESPFIAPPKIAFEVDPRREGAIFPSSSASHLTNGRNDPPTDATNYRGGHVALVYWGGETPTAATAISPCAAPAYSPGSVCTLPQEEDDNVHGQAAPARTGFPAPPPNPAAPIPRLNVPPDVPAGVYKLDPNTASVPANQTFHVRVELTRKAASYSLPRVRVATTAEINLVAPGTIDANGIHLLQVDDIYLFPGDRVLVKNQGDTKQNGIYVWDGAGKPMERAEDAESVEALAGLIVEVMQGVTYGGQLWRQQTVQPGICAKPIDCTNFSWQPARAAQFTDLPGPGTQTGRIVYVQKGDQANGWFLSDGSSWQRIWAHLSTQEAIIDLTNAPAAIDNVTYPGSPIRILVRHQGNAAENGVYLWSGAGIAMGRVGDFDAGPKLAGALVQVLSGTDAGRAFRQTAMPFGGIIGADAIVWEAIDASPSYLLEVWMQREGEDPDARQIKAMQDTTRPMSFLISAMNPSPNFPPKLRNTPVIPYPFRKARLGFTIGQSTSINDQTVTTGNYFTTWLP